MSRLHQAIEASLDAVPALGEAVRRLCLTEGVDATEASLVELALVEAVTNTIEHGYRGAHGRVEIDLRVTPERIAAEIHDTAPPVDPQRLAAPVRSEEALADRTQLEERGRGLEIIHGVFDDVTYQRTDAGNHLALSRLRRGATP